jgi:hypothetical protein
MFQSFKWNWLAAEQFRNDERPYFIAVEGASGAALVPAVVSRDGAGLAGETLFDYRDVLCVGDPQALRAAWWELAQLRCSFTLTAVRGETAREHWSSFDPVPFTTAPQVLPQEITPEQFSRQHSRVGRLWRRVLREGVELRQRSGTASELIRWIYRQKAQQFERTESIFVNPARIEFMVSVCALHSEACEVYSLERSGAVIAALVTFRDRNVRRFYTTYFDRQWARHSPGTLLLFEVTRLSLADGLECDYMTGDQSYKMRFKTSVVPLYRVHASPTALANLTSADETISQLAA